MRNILSSLEQLRIQLERSRELVALLQETVRSQTVKDDRETCWAHGTQATCVFCSPESSSAEQPAPAPSGEVDYSDKNSLGFKLATLDDLRMNQTQERNAERIEWAIATIHKQAEQLRQADIVEEEADNRLREQAAEIERLKADQLANFYAENERDNARTEIERLTRVDDRRTAELQTAQSERDEARAELAEARAEGQRFSEELHDAKTDVVGYRRCVEKLEGELAEARYNWQMDSKAKAEEIRRLEGELAEAKRELGVLSHECDGISEMLDELGVEQDGLQERVSMLIDKRDDLLQDRKALAKELEEAKRELERLGVVMRADAERAIRNQHAFQELQDELFCLRSAPAAEGPKGGPTALSAETRERIAQLTAHRACGSGEHDPQNGKLHGFCVVCLVPWPCAIAAPALNASAVEPTGLTLDRALQVVSSAWEHFAADDWTLSMLRERIEHGLQEVAGWEPARAAEPGADTRRLDWVERTGHSVICNPEWEPRARWDCGDTPGTSTVRAAIDAAIRAARGEEGE